MKRFSIIVIMVLMALGLNAQNEVLTLDSCFALARANNVKFKMNELDIQKAREVKAQVFTKYFPQVSLGFFSFYAAKPIIKYSVDDIDQGTDFGSFVVSVIHELQELGSDIPTEVNILKNGVSGSALAVVPVFAGGRIVNGNKLATLGIEAAQLQSEVSERDLLEEIETSYYLVLGLQEKVQTLNSALALIDSLDRTVETALKAGLITNSDKLRVALKRNELQANQLQLSNGIVLATLLLCHQIGISYPEGGLVLENNLDQVEEPTHNTLYLRPERRLLQLQIEAETFYKKLTIGETLPQVGVGSMASYGNITGRSQFNTILFATVMVPLTKWWETSHKLKEHDIKIREAELMQEDLNGMMDLQEKQAYNQMVEAEALLRSDRVAFEMAQENSRLATLNYRAGMNTIADVLEANALLLQAQNAITDRQITYASARRKYHDLTGN
ncbi:MAG: TolC family protein [Bacteroidales bacterium]|nr:TolC family protein [Bacteroidales bacterium]